MATLSFRLPTGCLHDRPLRSAAWSRDKAATKPAPPIRQGLPLVTEVLELLPPQGPSCIELPAKAAVAETCDESLAGGWFDSTWDLQQGLDVAEGAPSDLPLDAWLHSYLAS